MAKDYYGGAFDIDPYTYWTRDDLNELQSAIDDLSHGEFTILSLYLEEDKIFDIDYADKHENEYHLQQEISIDRRKAFTTKDLCEKYAPQIAEAIVKEIREYEMELEMEEYEDIMLDAL